MSPSVALSLWVVLLLGLLCFDPAREPKNSAALWVAVIWLFFLGSRTPSMWLGVSEVSDRVQALEQGNPLDRTVFSLLILLMMAILVSRAFHWRNFVAQNSALACFLAFALLSVAWSDFPLVTFKKWFRDLGIYGAILVVSSYPRQLDAVRTVLRRWAYLSIPLSVVLIKYYPALGQTFSDWGGQEYTGVSTSKNMLGLLCLASGMFFFWDTIVRWHQRRDVRVSRVILVNIAFIGMTLWLLNESASMTSTICLVIGCLVMAAAHSNFGRRCPSWIKALAPASFILYLILALGFGLSGQLSEAVGKRSDMSDRTHIWEVLLSAPINPVLGTGYQSFWLGPRVQWVWASLRGDNVLEAHNGYLAIYLELGVTGLFLLCAFLIASYRTICRRLNPVTPLGSLSLGLWTLLLFYNVTEAAFGGGLLWIALLMGSLTVPHRAKHQSHAPRSLALGATEQHASLLRIGPGQLRFRDVAHVSRGEMSVRQAEPNAPRDFRDRIVGTGANENRLPDAGPQ
jgi:O-antigen ligase